MFLSRNVPSVNCVVRHSCAFVNKKTVRSSGICVVPKYSKSL